MSDENVTSQVVDGKHEGPLTDSYIQNTLDQAFSQLPGAQKFVENLSRPAAQVPEITPGIVQQQQAQQEQNVEYAQQQQPEQQGGEQQGGGDNVADPEKHQATGDTEEDKRSQEKWNLYKQGYKEAQKLKGEIQGLQQKMQEFEGTRTQYEQLQKELSDLKQERESIEGELYKGRVESSRKFQNQVTEPFNTLFKASEIVAKDNDIDHSALFGAIVRGDRKAVKEIVSGIEDYDRFQVYTMFDDMRRVVQARDNLFADSKATYEADLRSQQEQEKKQATDIQQKRQQHINEIVPALTERVISLLPESRRQDLESMKGEVATFDQWPEEVKMYGGYASILLPEVIESFQETQVALREAQEEIAKLRGSSPKIGNGQPAMLSAAPAKDTADYRKMSTDTLAAQGVARLRQSLGLPPA